MRPVITAAAMALLLASCGSREEADNDAAGAGNMSAPANDQAAAGDGPAGAATAELRPGQWETTVEILRMDLGNVPGMPAGVTPPVQAPVTVRSCITPEQARRPDAGFMTGAQDKSGCSYEDFSMSGGRLRGTVTCNQQGSTVRATFDGSFGAESYRLESESRVSANGTEVSTATRITARRIGDCPG